VSLRLYDTATRSLRSFDPLEPGKVSIYHCGLTVQGLPHIGHLRGAGIVYDVLRRWLEHSGYQVVQVRNITDIDDKILAKASDAGREWWDWAAANERAAARAFDTLGCLPPTVEPRATAHIPQIVQLIAILIDAGLAYSACGDVYFAVREQPDYGFLSGQRIDEMQQGESEGHCKKDPADFTLWKAAKPGEPSWDSPWGPGRPGWHIECTAMARTYLGDRFDIHGGGLDLIFPHHENEAAQAHGANLEFAGYWMHSHWVTMAGEKMSKSLGNTMSVEVITRNVRPIALRYYLVSVHYRTAIEYSPEALADAATAFERIESMLRRVSDRLGSVAVGDVPPEFAEAMDDDLSVPRAIAVVHDRVRAANGAAAVGDWNAAGALAGEVRGMLAVLGLDPFAAPWVSDQSAAQRRLVTATSALLDEFLLERTAARADKDFTRADAIRNRLAAAGFLIEDTPDGPVWSLAAGGDEG
jgi:cysteinyl-tRNA synthetase